MNLVKEPWVPVVKTNGDKTEASLLDMFLSGTAYADLAVRSHERVALMRLLICIAQAALGGPENLGQWEKVPGALPGKAEEYLTKWQDSFDLFHPEKPFLQIEALEPSGLSPVCKLDFAMAAGNATTLFDHRGNDAQARPVPKGQLALNMVTFQNFSPGGGASIATWKEVSTKQVGNPDAPCLKGAMYHAFLKGPNIVETFHLNLLTKRAVELVFGNGGWGKPVWELMPSGPNDQAAIINASNTYLGRLVPLSRWIKLHDQSWMIWGNGFTYPVFPDFRCPEPSATSVEGRDQQGRPVHKLLRASHARGIWRQLAALVVKRRDDSLGGALALENVPNDKDFEIHVCALLRNQATIEASQESVFHVPSSMHTNIGRKSYEEEVAVAEANARRLGRAVEKWRREVDADWEQRVKASRDKWALLERLRSIATNHFWTAVEKSLPLLLAYTSCIGEKDKDTRKNLWRRTVHRAAREAYELACGRDSPRQLRAFTMGLRVLEGEEMTMTEKQEE